MPGNLRPRRAERQVQALFFAHFAFVGAHAPYLSLFFEAAGYSVAQIGLLMAVPQALRIVAPPVWGALADRYRDRAGMLLVIGALFTAASVALLPWAAGAGFAISMLMLAAMFFSSAGITPITEAAALSLSAGHAGRYGAMRLWGSIGFVLAVLTIGPALDASSLAYLPWFLVSIALGIVLVGLRLRLDSGIASRDALGRVRARLREPHIALFFLASFLMLFAHAALYVLFSLFLLRHGYSKTEIGLFWGLSVLAEIVLFRLQAGLFARFGAGTLMGVSIATAALRFCLVGGSDGFWPVLVLTQLLHAVTFGLHHSSVMTLLHQWFAPAQQARAQALYITIGYGCGGTLGGLAMSAIWERYSPSAAFWGAGLAAGLGALVALYSSHCAPNLRDRAPQTGDA